MSERTPETEPTPSLVARLRAAVIFDPELAVSDDFDARLLLILWAARKSFFPLLWLGFIVAAGWFLAIDGDAEAFLDRLNEIQSPDELWKAVLSPFAIAAFAISARVVVGLLALSSTFRFMLAVRAADYPNANRVSRLWRTLWDRWQIGQAYRSFRWSWRVRAVVLDRVGTEGRWWRAWDVAMLVANIVLFLGFFVVLAIATAQIPESASP